MGPLLPKWSRDARRGPVVAYCPVAVRHQPDDPCRMPPLSPLEAARPREIGADPTKMSMRSTRVERQLHAVAQASRLRAVPEDALHPRRSDLRGEVAEPRGTGLRLPRGFPRLRAGRQPHALRVHDALTFCLGRRRGDERASFRLRRRHAEVTERRLHTEVIETLVRTVPASGAFGAGRARDH